MRRFIVITLLILMFSGCGQDEAQKLKDRLSEQSQKNELAYDRASICDDLQHTHLIARTEKYGIMYMKDQNVDPEKVDQFVDEVIECMGIAYPLDTPDLCYFILDTERFECLTTESADGCAGLQHHNVIYSNIHQNVFKHELIHWILWRVEGASDSAHESEYWQCE